MEKIAIFMAIEKMRERSGLIVADDDTTLSPARIRQPARAFPKEHGSLDCVVVDYL